MINLQKIGRLAIAGLMVCMSCTDERLFSGNASDLMKDVVVGREGFVTRSSTGSEARDSVILSDLPYVTGNGDTIYISAFLSDMDVPVAVDTRTETKGAPITGELFGTYTGYNEFITRVYPASGTDCYESVNNFMDNNPIAMSAVTVSYQSSKWKLDKKYYWPQEENANLYFVSIAPKVLWSDGHITDHTAAASWNPESHKYSFTYHSIIDTPTGTDNGVEQYDLMVAYNKQNKDTYQSSVHIDLKHACVGVKFVMGDIFGNIASMSLQNFYKDAKITLGEGSPEDGALVEFSDYAHLSSFVQKFDFETETHKDIENAPLDETENDTKTFMVIPQKLIERGDDIPDADLVIEMGNTLHPEVLSFSDLANPEKGGDGKLADWSSYGGKIITFKVSSRKANNVSVSITDEIVSGDAGYPKKQNVVITNTGRSDIYIRATLVGSWQNAAGQNLKPWSEADSHGVFTGGLLGADTQDDTYWVKGTDGFYYYKRYIIGAKGGERHTVQYPLFTSFQLTSAPVSGGIASGDASDDATVHDLNIARLKLTVMVQAVVATQDMAAAKAAWGNDVATFLTTNYD